MAVKILARELVSDGRFEREARAAARLSHPGIVTLYEAMVDDDGAYLVSELVDGATLDRLLADGSVSDRDILRIGLALCDALDHAHGQGVVHRDVKPSNVLVPAKRSDDRPPVRGQAAKLTDFGVARVIDSDSLTLTGDVIGTLNYMSPEQAAGLEASEPADLYSLAVVLYEALTGINPLRSGANASIRDGCARRCCRRCVASAGTCRRPWGTRSIGRCSRRPPIAARSPTCDSAWSARCRRSVTSRGS